MPIATKQPHLRGAVGTLGPSAGCVWSQSSKDLQLLACDGKCPESFHWESPPLFSDPSGDNFLRAATFLAFLTNALLLSYGRIFPSSLKAVTQ